MNRTIVRDGLTGILMLVLSAMCPSDEEKSENRITSEVLDLAKQQSLDSGQPILVYFYDSI